MLIYMFSCEDDFDLLLPVTSQETFTGIDIEENGIRGFDLESRGRYLKADYHAGSGVTKFQRAADLFGGCIGDNDLGVSL